MVDNNIIRFPDLSCFTEQAFRTAFSITAEPNSSSSSFAMEEMKKRKMDEVINGGETANQELLRSLLDPLSKSQLIDLLSRLGTQYPSIAEEIKSLASADPVHRKLFVRGLAWTTTSDSLCAAFQMHGEIEEGAVIHDKTTGKSRGYGFITFKHMESAQSALKAPGKLIDGRLAVCNLACEGLSGASSTPDLAQRKLYIGGLPPEITSEALLKYFGRHGEIEEGSVAYDKDTNESRGFGFVTYKTLEAAKKALDDPQKTLGARSLIVKLADTNKGKAAQLQSAAPAPVLPMAQGPLAPFPTGYAQPGRPHTGTPVGYAYPQAVGGSYPPPPSSYTSPPTMHPVYQMQPQIPYSQAAARKDTSGMSTSAPVGISGGYPYFHPK
ncbi:UBP1-associated protein 2C [Linum perenne]